MAVVCEHEPFGKQQAPKSPHAAHVVPAPAKLPPCWAHSVAESSWQVPSGKQHPPVATQSVGVHGTERPWKMPPREAQLASDMTTQVESGRQQAPGGSQLTFAQFVLGPRKTPF